MANGPWGDGVDDYILSPVRTVATDPKVIPHGTILYIPEARGAEVVMPNGRKIIHDGFFFAGDKGGAIKGNHIDVYIGTFKKAPIFPWIKSNETKTFTAFRVLDKKVIDRLTELHLLR
jgi:3D (Asp-Asp-Asp) domain-containing protein